MASIPIVNTIDKRVGAVSSIVAMLLLLIVMFFLTFEIADPPPQDVPITMAEALDVTEIENVVVQTDGGGGGGSESENPETNPNQTEQVITNENSQSDAVVNNGQGNVTNSTQDNPPAGNNTPNHFGDGGTDGQGGGSGGHFGSDNGAGNNGNGAGSGGGGRKVIRNVSFNMEYDHAVTFSFKVLIDSKGNVMSAQVVKGSTTTTDQVLINKVRQAIISQVKYSKADGAPAVTKIYLITLQPK